MVSSAATKVRVRLAPSPTGNLHVGTARTGLFNYLFAKHNNGQFILRIEDTDLERSEAQYTQNIFDGLKALGLQWDEGPDVGGAYGPYVQSQRLELYAKAAQTLLESGHAYYSYATDEELDTAREKATALKRPFIYREDPAKPEQIEAWKADPKRTPSLRLRVPRENRALIVHDDIRGEVSFDTSLIGDFVLMKSNGTPAYNFAVVVDDALMQITHVIRGEDHLSNTPKQLLLYEALGYEPPRFAHLSMILSPDRSKLSKRHGATAVSDYIDEQGYFSEAFVNFLALLGWSAPDTQELFTMQELISLFSLQRIAHSGAIFDKDKLNWMNAHYVRAMALPELLERSRPYLQALEPEKTYSDEQLQLILSLVREPISKLDELPAAVSYFFGNDVAVLPDIQESVLATEDTKTVLQFCLNAMQEEAIQQAFTEGVEPIKALLKQWGEALKPLKTKTVMWALRAATTGRVQGADLPSVLWLLGTQRVQHRLQAALAAKVTTEVLS